MKIIVCDKYISGNIEKDKKLKHRMLFLWLPQTKGELYIIMVVLLINKYINIIYPGRYFNPMKHTIVVKHIINVLHLFWSPTQLSASLN